MPTFAKSALESALESANSSPESADSTTDFMTAGRLPILNMFNISTRSSLWSADYWSSGYGPLAIAVAVVILLASFCQYFLYHIYLDQYDIILKLVLSTQLNSLVRIYYVPIFINCIKGGISDM